MSGCETRTLRVAFCFKKCRLFFLTKKSADFHKGTKLQMHNGVCVRCGRHFVNALQLGAHVRFCNHGDNLRGADNGIIAVPVAPRDRRISLHSLARRAPAPWGRHDMPVQNDRRDIPISQYIRDYQPVCVIFIT